MEIPFRKVIRENASTTNLTTIMSINQYGNRSKNVNHFDSINPRPLKTTTTTKQRAKRHYAPQKEVHPDKQIDQCKERKGC